MKSVLQRLFDIIVSIALIIIGAPIILIVALLVRVKLGGGVLFVQQRPGKGAKPFYMLKFRSMINQFDLQGDLEPDTQRLTRFGAKLRSTSLDELPELWNVLKGEMSLVGPRPLLMEYLPLYTPEQARRHDVRPGITGWAQVNGRNAISWDEKFALDVWYVDNRSFWLDLKIILMTIRKVVLREGISADGSATMPKFMGQEERIDQ